jgi:hypothetical protein
MDGSSLFMGLDARRVLRNQRRLEMRDLDSPFMALMVRAAGNH